MFQLHQWDTGDDVDQELQEVSLDTCSNYPHNPDENGSSSEESDDDRDLQLNLKEWAVNQKITRAALTGLLHSLKPWKSHIFLLLDTDNDSAIFGL